MDLRDPTQGAALELDSKDVRICPLWDDVFPILVNEPVDAQLGLLGGQDWEWKTVLLSVLKVHMLRILDI